MANWEDPYLNKEEQTRLCIESGLSKSQVSNWFLNARKRHLKPLDKNAKNKRKFIINQYINFNII